MDSRDLDLEARLSTEDATLSMMVLYDGLESRAIAKNIYHSVCDRLTAGAGANLSLWPFEALENPQTERLARGDLTEADLLMVAVDGLHPLPLQIRKSLENWLTGQDPLKVGLVAILRRLDEHKKELSPAHSYLQALARKAKTEFFSQAVAAPPQNESPLLSTRRPLAIDFVWDEDSFSLSVSIDHWGLNE